MSAWRRTRAARQPVVDFQRMTTITSLPQLLDRLSTGETFDYLHFWGHRQRADGAITASCFSQWAPVRFDIDGVVYPSAEHFMMAEKARLFGDHATLAQVLVASTPNAADDSRASDPRQWDGLNLLGFALMVVRDRLARGRFPDVDRTQSHHCLQSYRRGEIMTLIMKITSHFLARVGQVNKATQAT